MGPLYPNVPIALGVPPVLRLPGQSEPPIPPLRSSSSQLEGALFQWGIFDQDGILIVNADNIVSVEDGVEYRVADYPLEKGAFESYNKVATPREARLAMSKGGTLADRQEFLKTLQSLEPKLDLYNVVTPEEVMINMNIIAVRKARNQTNGATMITVEVTLHEIRITATSTQSNSKEPSGADPINNGSVQTTSLDFFPTLPPMRNIQ